MPNEKDQTRTIIVMRKIYVISFLYPNSIIYAVLFLLIEWS